MTSEGELFFLRKLSDVKEAFDQSDIKVAQERQRRDGSRAGHWYYSLTAVPLRPGRPVLFGLNWGVNKATGHEPQVEYPDKRAWLDVASYDHVDANRSRIETALGPLQELNYLNVCPFRSPGIDDLTDRDWRLGVNAFLTETMEFLAPPRALFHGTRAVDELRRLGLVDDRPVVVPRANKRSKGFVGWVRTGAHQTPFHAIPRARDLHSESEIDLLWDSILAETP